MNLVFLGVLIATISQTVAEADAETSIDQNPSQSSDDTYLIEGDIIPSKRHGLRFKRQAAAFYVKWENGKIYYFLDASINARRRTAISAAMKYISSKTCIDFVESTTNTDRVKIFSGNGCYSLIGQEGGVQELSLGNGCEVIGTVVHELMHVIGIFHMQSRNDRDKYLKVNMTYVPADMRSNFDKHPADEVINYTPYEYGSVMHYGGHSMTKPKDKVSMIPKDARFVNTIGSQIPSFYDMKMINDFYQCHDRCPKSSSAKCKNGGEPNPRNCAICNCPLGYGGSLCGIRPAGCGRMLSATNKWQSQNVRFGADDAHGGAVYRNDFMYCNHWITAPQGTHIEVKVTKIVKEQCEGSCRFNGIEIKGLADKRITNPRVCCQNKANVIVRSALNPTPIVSYNRRGFTEFTFQYRYVGKPGTTPKHTTTKKPTTTKAKATTRKTALPHKRSEKRTACYNLLKDEECQEKFEEGFCNNTEVTIREKKYMCAKTCGLCGIPVTPCVDTYDRCESTVEFGLCDGEFHEMRAEYQCAKSCGFCDWPTGSSGGPSTSSEATTSEESDSTSTTSTTNEATTTTTTTTTTSTTINPSSTSTQKTATKRASDQECYDTLSESQCQQKLQEGFCNSTEESFQLKKYMCGKTCGLCGLAASPCVDLYDTCQRTLEYGLCEGEGLSMRAEYQCAKSCGYCENPTGSVEESSSPNTSDIPPIKCEDGFSETYCEGRKKNGFCESTEDTFEFKKFACAKTCGLCGKAATPCVDRLSDCQSTLENGLCDFEPTARRSEYDCAKTCGYCEHPI